MKVTATLSCLLYLATAAFAAPTALEKRTSYSGGLTSDDVKNRAACTDLTFIFARGSTERGTMGSSVGPALANQLIKTLGRDRVSVQGVDYTATVNSNVLRGSEGGKVMADLANAQAQRCPNSKIAIAGYSQGAMVVHYAVKSAGLSPSKVSSAVLYGDPQNRESVGSLPASQTKKFCNRGDGVCETGTFSISSAHLAYSRDGSVAEGASFIVQQAGLS
ncbi:hypothetical protein Q7P37_000814 [Cladosporium fusiforme]